jgi:hypothetical protein
VTSAPSIALLRKIPGLAIRPDPDGPRATLVAAEGLDEILVAEAAAALRSDVETRDYVVKGIQRWRSIMAQLRAEHGGFIEDGGAHSGHFLPPSWYVAMHEDLLVVDAALRDRFCVDFCLSGPVDDPDAPLKRVDCKEPAPDGRFDARLACEYCNQEHYEGLYRQCFGS